jgi:hypothetical protein
MAKAPELVAGRAERAPAPDVAAGDSARASLTRRSASAGSGPTAFMRVESMRTAAICVEPSVAWE